LKFTPADGATFSNTIGTEDCAGTPPLAWASVNSAKIANVRTILVCEDFMPGNCYLSKTHDMRRQPSSQRDVAHAS